MKKKPKKNHFFLKKNKRCKKGSKKTDVVSVFLNHFGLTRVITERNFVFFAINNTTDFGSEYHFKSLIFHIKSFSFFLSQFNRRHTFPFNVQSIGRFFVFTEISCLAVMTIVGVYKFFWSNSIKRVNSSTASSRINFISRCFLTCSSTNTMQPMRVYYASRW